MRPDLARLFVRLTTLAAPLVLVLLSYVALDPFSVVRRHLDYPDYLSNMRFGVSPNREVLGTEILLRHHAERGYDAFIFGNSRSLPFQTSEWLRWIGPARPFHYDASREPLFGLRGKFRLIDRENIPLRKALLLIDQDLLAQTTETEGVIFSKHPAVSQAGQLRFQSVFLKAYLSQLFFVRYLDFRLFGKWRPYMAGVINQDLVTPGYFGNNLETSDVQFLGADAQLDSDPQRHYETWLEKWPRAANLPVESPAVIGSSQIEMLSEIHDILTRKGTDFQVGIVPTFEKVPLNAEDLSHLRTIFGADRVHDFSGDRSLGDSIQDWYDPQHFRRPVAEQILRRIYEDRSRKDAPMP